MAEAKKTRTAPAAPAQPKLAHVSTSGQADVHHLVAERFAAESDPERLAAVDARLAELGFYV